MLYDDVIDNAVGVVTGTNAAVQFPAIGIGMVRFKADGGNGSNFYLGQNGTATYPLAAGDDTGWVYADDLADYWYKGSGSCYLHYWFQK